jgi:hypothetical protein
MMLSEGETYCFALDAKLMLVGHRRLTMVEEEVVSSEDEEEEELTAAD